jgi:hypothetical protein
MNVVPVYAWPRSGPHPSSREEKRQENESVVFFFSLVALFQDEIVMIKKEGEKVRYAMRKTNEVGFRCSMSNGDQSPPTRAQILKSAHFTKMYSSGG